VVPSGISALARPPAIAYGRAAARFGKTRGSFRAMTEPLDHHAALIFAMVTMSAVDRTMTDAELARIGEIVSNLPVFADFDQERLVKTAEACGGVLSEDGGLDRAFALIKGGLPKKLRETAYAIALEVAAADMDVKPEETRFLEMLRDTLDLDRLTAAAIERGIRARNLVL
jgi:tellurite resistance protein